MIPPLAFWFSGTAWVSAALTFLALAQCVLETKGLIVTRPINFVGLVLAWLILIGALLSWWTAAVSEMEQAPRRLSEAQQNKLVEILKINPNTNVRISVSSIMGDSEAYTYAEDWVRVLNSAGWNVQQQRVLIDPPKNGIRIKIKSMALADALGIGVFIHACKSIGIDNVKATFDEKVAENQIDFLIGNRD